MAVTYAPEPTTTFPQAFGTLSAKPSWHNATAAAGPLDQPAFTPTRTVTLPVGNTGSDIFAAWTAYFGNRSGNAGTKQSGDRLVVPGDFYTYSDNLEIPPSANNIEVVFGTPGNQTILRSTQMSGGLVTNHAIRQYGTNIRLRGVNQNTPAVIESGGVVGRNGLNQQGNTMLLLDPGSSDTYVQDMILRGARAAGFFAYTTTRYWLNRVTVEDSLADGFHNTQGSTYGLFTDCVSRRAGDDGIAFVYYDGNAISGQSHHMEVYRHIVDTNGHGRGFANINCTDIVADQVIVRGSAAAGVIIDREASSGGTDHGSIARTLLQRFRIEGANWSEQDHGAVFLRNGITNGTVTGVVMESFEINNPSANHQMVRTIGDGTANTVLECTLTDFRFSGAASTNAGDQFGGNNTSRITRSGWANINLTPNVENIPPTVVINTPGRYATVTGVLTGSTTTTENMRNTQAIQFYAGDGGAKVNGTSVIDVANVEVKIGDTVIGTVAGTALDSAKRGSQVWDTTAFQNGPALIQVKGTDKQGFTRTTSRMVTVSNATPGSTSGMPAGQTAPTNVNATTTGVTASASTTAPAGSATGSGARTIAGTVATATSSAPAGNAVGSSASTGGDPRGIGNISGLVAWYRRDSITPTTAGQNVTQWTDLAAGNNATNAATGGQPLVAGNPVTGATFSSGKILRSNASASLLAESLFVAAKPSTSAGYLAMRGGSGSGSSGAHAFILINGKQVLSRQGVSDTLSGTNAYTVGAVTNFAMTYVPGDVRLYQNGAANGTSTSSAQPTASRTWQIGAGYNEADNFQGDLNEFIQVNRVVTAAERAQINSHLYDNNPGMAMPADYVALSTPTVVTGTTAATSSSAPAGTATGTAAGGGGTSALLIDSFTRTSTTTAGTAETGQVWMPTGTWGTDGSTLGSVSKGDGNWIRADVGTTVQEFEAKHTAGGANCYPAIMVNIEGGGSWYRAEFDPNGQITLARGINSTYTQLAQSSTGVMAVGKTIKLKSEIGATSTVLTVSVNGVQVLQGTDTWSASGRAKPTGTSVGFRHGAAGTVDIRWDDAYVNRVASTPATIAGTTATSSSAAPAGTATGTAPVAATTFVNAVAVDNAGSNVASLTAPTGVTNAHLGIAVLNTANSTTVNPSIPGWTRVAADPSGQANSAFYVFTRLGGVTAGDTITATMTSNNAARLTAAWYNTSGRDIAIVGTPGTRNATSTTALVIPGVTTTAALQDVIVIATERTTATGTVISSWSPTTPTQDIFGESTNGTTVNAVSQYIGRIRPSTAGSTGNYTATYSGGSTNGSGMMLAVAAAAPAAANATVTGVTPGASTTAPAGATSVVTPAPVVIRAMVGLPGTNNIRVTARTQYTQTVRMAVSTAADMSNPVYGTSVTPDAQGYATNVTVTGLNAGTTYYYRLELNGSLTGAATPIKTMPVVGSEQSFRIVWGSCVKSGGGYPDVADWPVFNAIGQRAPDEFHFLGDLHYANRSTSPDGAVTPADATYIRNAYETAMTKPALASLMAKTPTIHTYSDNDFAGSNSDSTAPAAAITPTVWRQIMAYPDLVATDGKGIYHAHQRGRVLFINTDGRSYMTDKAATDNAAKTKLGTDQKAWLKNLLSTTNAKVILWLHEQHWLGGAATGGGIDSWQAFNTERTEIGAYIQANAKAPVIYLAGDTHTLQADNGASNAWGAFPTAGGAPYYQDAQVWPGGSWGTPTNGSYPTTNSSNQSYYGLLDVVDTGKNITVTIRGYDDTASQGVAANDVERTTPMTFTYDTPSVVGTTATSSSSAPAGTVLATSPATIAGTTATSSASTTAGIAASSSTITGTVRATVTVLANAGSTAATQTVAIPGTAAKATAASAAGTATATAVITGSSGGTTTTYRGFDGYTPPTENANDTTAYSLGTEFYVTSSAQLTSIRVWCPTGSTGTRTPRVWDVSTGSLLRTGPAVSAVPGTWVEMPLDAPADLTVSKRYRATVVIPAGGQYAATPEFFSNGLGKDGITNGPLYIPSAFDVPNQRQGSFSEGAAVVMPDGSFKAANYWVAPIAAVTTGGGPSSSATSSAYASPGAVNTASSTTVAGTTAATATQSQPGVVSTSSTIGGTVATATAKSTPGTPAATTGATVIGTTAPATGVAPTGAVTTIPPPVVGTPATASAKANPGVFAATATVVGTPGTSTTQSPAGAATGRATVTGATATSSTVANPGTVNAGIRVVGTTATTTATSAPGAVTYTAVIVGTPATATALGRPGNAATSDGNQIIGDTANVSASIPTGALSAGVRIVGTSSTSTAQAAPGTTQATSGATITGTTATTTARTNTGTVGYGTTTAGITATATSQATAGTATGTAGTAVSGTTAASTYRATPGTAQAGSRIIGTVADADASTTPGTVRAGTTTTGATAQATTTITAGQPAANATATGSTAATTTRTTAGTTGASTTITGALARATTTATPGQPTGEDTTNYDDIEIDYLEVSIDEYVTVDVAINAIDITEVST